MSRLQRYILAPGQMNEASYEGNLGMEEMFRLYQKATDKQLEKLEKIMKNEDWEGFKELVYEVIGKRLK